MEIYNLNNSSILLDGKPLSWYNLNTSLHTFTTNGTMVIPYNTQSIDYLIVGGGGSGGSVYFWGQPYCAGAGGAGGLLTGTILNPSAGSYPVVIGAGGTKPSINYEGNNGGNSSFYSLTAIGGGRGSVIIEGNILSPGAGGNGGGGYYRPTPEYGNGNTGTAGQGNDGGNAGIVNSVGCSGGGGGKSSAGQAYYGGTGYTSSISGSAVVYSTGGDGVNYVTSNFNGYDGLDNTGDGGDGSRSYSAISYGGAGGSGIVILRINYYS